MCKILLFLLKPKEMKNAIVAGFCAILGFPALSQSFSVMVVPATQTITQGSSVGLSFNLSVTPTGGYNSSVYFQLMLPPALVGQVTLSTQNISNPYPAISIGITKPNSLPPGVHQFSVHAYNGPLSQYGIYQITVNANACPDWFVYKAENSPLTANMPVVTAIDKSGKFWTGVITTGPANRGSLICFDRQTWRVWSTADFRTYNITGSLTAVDTTQWISGDGVGDICNNGDTIYALTYQKIHRVVNNQLTDISGPATAQPYRRIKVDHLNRLWLLTDVELYRYTSAGWASVNFSSAPFPSGTPIFDFEIDLNGNIWVGVKWYGIHKFDGSLWTTYINPNNPNMQDCQLARAPNGILWASDNGALHKYNSTMNSFVAFNTPQGGCWSITFDPVTSDPVIGTNGIGVYAGSNFTVYNQFNSPVISGGNGALAKMAHTDQYKNLIVADYGGGFIFHCGDPNQPLSISDLKSSKQIHAYPNPFSDKLTVEGLNEDLDYQYAILNQLGSHLKSGNNKGTATLEIEMKELSPGIYFLVLRNETERKFVRLIKE
jgi:hypothetical protein